MKIEFRVPNDVIITPVDVKGDSFFGLDTTYFVLPLP